MGLVLRALRLRRGLRQRDVAARAGCSQSVVSRLEAGHVTEATVELLRRVFLALEARLDLAPRWRGAELERLLDADHASVVERVAAALERAAWAVAVEVTYSDFGERGSIDVLATRADVRAALVVEVKTAITSAERVGRKLDEKARLARSIVRERDGWTPAVVGRALAMPERSTLRRIVEATPVLRRMFPVGGRELAGWLRGPTGDVAAMWFLSGIAPRNGRRAVGPSRAPRGLVAGASHARNQVPRPAAAPESPSSMPPGDS